MTPCIEWQGARTKHGYGHRAFEGKFMNAHRVAWIVANGPIADGLQVLHRCDNRLCVNVAHLFLGTVTDNMRDMVAKGRHASQLVTHCPHGHEYAPENTRIDSDGRRRCRACEKAQRAERRRAVAS